jgi:hypothetical protein
MAQTFSIASAHIKVYVNGKLLGYAISVPSWNIRSDWGRLQEIDSVITRQLAPRMYAVSGTFQVLRGRATGGLEGAGLVTTAESMLRQKYATIELQDRVSQDIIFRGLQCVVTQQSWQINPKSLVVGSFNFEGLVFANESVS